MIQRKGILHLFVIPPICHVYIYSIADISSLRFTGTITGIGDASAQWIGSKWRSLNVNNLPLFTSPIGSIHVLLSCIVHFLGSMG